MFKILDKFGGEVSANEQAIFNKISTNNSSGYVNGYLNNLAIARLTSNTISIDSGLLSIQGFRFANDTLQTYTVSVTPSQPIPFQLVAVFSHYVSSENDTLSIITRPTESLRQENLYGGSNAVYELELARFTMTADGITDFVATLEQLTYNDQDFTTVLEQVATAETNSAAALEAATTAKTNSAAAVNTANTAKETANAAKTASDTATAKVAELSTQIGEKQGTTVTIGGVAQGRVALESATVGNAEKLGNKAASEYASASDIPDVSNFAEKTGTYSKMSVGNATNATNLIPDAIGAVNPLGRRGGGTVGKNSTALGDNTIASGEFSTAIGANASAGGLRSIALGYNASASGNGSTALGDSASAGGTGSTALGDSASAGGTGSTALGNGAIVSESDRRVIQLGSGSLSALRCKVNLTVTSDKRDKTDISDITNALAFLEKLNPVTFASNDRVNYISEEDKQSEKFRKYGMCEYDRVSHALGTKKGERRRCGLLAQEVIAAMQEVYGTDNYANIVNDNFHDLQEKPSDVENKYTLAYANLVPFLIGAIKELNAEIKILKDKLNDNN